MSIALVLSLFGPSAGNAQPLRDRVLQDVEIHGPCIVVGFSFPVQYIRHFPAESGDELRIRIRPTPIGRIDGDAVHGREAVRPPSRSRLHLSEVIFEGDVVGGPYLVVNFDREVHFRVAPGRDFRSIVILVGKESGDAPCFPQ